MNWARFSAVSSLSLRSCRAQRTCRRLRNVRVITHETHATFCLEMNRKQTCRLCYCYVKKFDITSLKSLRCTNTDRPMSPLRKLNTHRSLLFPCRRWCSRPRLANSIVVSDWLVSLRTLRENITMFYRCDKPFTITTTALHCATPAYNERLQTGL